MLISPERINAAANIVRFNGWVDRHYSILEHMVIGAKVLELCGGRIESITAFLVHDLHETAIVGDVPTPDKRAYMKPNYFHDVMEWDKKMCAEAGIDLWRLESSAVKDTDAIMAAVESQLIYTGDWRAYHPDDNACDVASRLITSEVFRGNLAIPAFWDMWEQYGSKVKAA